MPKRLFHILAICVFAVTMLGASSPDTRIDKIGHKLVCQCGCGQILLECNHVGCPVSPVMIEELKGQVASGTPDTGIFNTFISKYGPIVLASPMRGGFDDVAWIVPFAVMVLATLGVALLIRFWKRRHDSMVPATAGAAAILPSSPMQDRIRRDTDYDSWSEK